MRRYLPRLAMIAGLALALTACGSTTGATTGGWTHASAPPTSWSCAARRCGDPVLARTCREDLDRGLRPRLHARDAHGRRGRHVRGRVQNTGSTLHDVTFADGTKLSAEGGKTATGTVTIPAAGLTFLCSIPGHADAGMKGEVMVAGAAPAQRRPDLSPGARQRRPSQIRPHPSTTLFDATAPKLLAGTVHDIDFPIIDKDITVAEGFVVNAWTFGGQFQGRRCGSTSVTRSTST